MKTINTLKTLACTALMLLAGFSLMPQQSKMDYTTTLRDADGQLIKNTTVKAIVELVTKDLTTNEQKKWFFYELHTVTSNEYGIINIPIGRGTDRFDNMRVDWADYPKEKELSKRITLRIIGEMVTSL